MLAIIIGSIAIVIASIVFPDALGFGNPTQF